MTPTPPKFENGFRITILPRVEKKSGWQNNYIGLEAIIEFSDSDAHRTDNPDPGDYDVSQACYSLLVIGDKDKFFRLRWYEENSLELMCQNAEKGKKLIEKYKEANRIGA